MTKQERYKAIAERLLNTFGLTGWSVHLVNFPEPYRLGLCSYRTQTIKLSNHHVAEDSDGYIIETIAEEIGHALTPGDTNHGERWKSARDRVWHLLLEHDASSPRSALWYLRHANNQGSIRNT